MRKLLFFVAILFTLTAKAQTSSYHTFPDSNIVWVEQEWYTDFTPPIPCIIYHDNDLYISGDTIIGTYTYHKLYRNGYWHCYCSGPNYYYNGQYSGAFREDSVNRKVYMSINGIDTLAYDFNLNVGDTIPMTYLFNSRADIIKSIDSVLVGNQYHKQFWFGSSFSIYGSLIEGIGTSLGAFSIVTPPFEAGNYLYCVKIDGHTVWNNPEFPNTGCSLLSVNENSSVEHKISIDPNPLHNYSVLSVGKEFNNAELKTYDALGNYVRSQKIASPSSTINREGLSNGIYFIKITSNRGSVITKKFIVE